MQHSSLTPSARGARTALCQGTVLEVARRNLWIRTVRPISHPAARWNRGRIFLDTHDVEPGVVLQPGDLVQFFLYVDAKGLGAEGCVRLDARKSSTVDLAAPPHVAVDLSAFSDSDSDEEDDCDVVSQAGTASVVMVDGKPDSVCATTDASGLTDHGSNPDSDEDLDYQSLCAASPLLGNAVNFSDYSDFSSDEDEDEEEEEDLFPPGLSPVVAPPQGLSLPTAHMTTDVDGCVCPRPPPGLRPPPPSCPPPLPPAHLQALLAAPWRKSASTEVSPPARPRRRRTHRGRRRKSTTAAGTPSIEVA